MPFNSPTFNTAYNRHWWPLCECETHFCCVCKWLNKTFCSCCIMTHKALLSMSSTYLISQLQDEGLPLDDLQSYISHKWLQWNLDYMAPGRDDLHFMTNWLGLSKTSIKKCKPPIVQCSFKLALPHMMPHWDCQKKSTKTMQQARKHTVAGCIVKTRAQLSSTPPWQGVCGGSMHEGCALPAGAHSCHMTPLTVQSASNAFTGQVVLKWP